MIVEQIAEEVGASKAVTGAVVQRVFIGHRLAKDELVEVLPIIKGIVAFYQQRVMGRAPDGTLMMLDGADAALAEFKEWLRLFIDTGFKLAEFQSPRFRAIMATVHHDLQQPGGFDPAKVTRLGDPVAVARAYAQTMKAPRELALPPLAKRQSD
jgi:hypothetical protein